jgi:hypothetical protein
VSEHPAIETLRNLDDLSADERETVLDHAAVCERCRETLASEDPTRIFALLRRRRIPERLLDDLSSDISAAIDAGKSAQRIPASRRSWAVGAWAAAVLLAAGLVLVSDDGAPRAPVDPAVAEVNVKKTTPRATVAVLESPGEAQVVDLAVGEIQVVMIFDQEMEL